MRTVRKQFGNVIRLRADDDEKPTRRDDVGTLWPSWKDCRATARRAIAATRKEGRPLLNHNGMWYERTAGTHYRLLSERDLKKKLYDMLEHARYATGEDKSAPWQPNPNRIKGVVEAAYGLADAGVDPPGWLDGRDEPVIPCQNGLLRVADRKLLRHSADYFNVYVLPFEYARRAECPRWKQFLDEVFPGDKRSQRLLQEWFGYIISGRTDLQKMLMLIGVTRSGKGTIEKVLSAFVGDRGHVGLSSSDLKGNFGLSKLVGKTLAVFSDTRVEIESRHLVELLLRIVGEDAVSIDIKYQHPWTGRLGTRFMLMSNEPPTLPDSSRAILSRILALHMPVSWKGREDRDLLKKLLPELPGIFNWALDGLDLLNERGRFVQPTGARHLLDRIEENASPITQFVDERCELDPHGAVAKAELFAAWQVWCDAHKQPVGNDNTFATALYAATAGRVRSKKARAGRERVPSYTGIALTSKAAKVRARSGLGPGSGPGRNG